MDLANFCKLLNSNRFFKQRLVLPRDCFRIRVQHWGKRAPRGRSFEICCPPVFRDQGVIFAPEARRLFGGGIGLLSAP